MTSITCLPQKICSWNYLITVSNSDVTASVEFDFMSERGNIILEADSYKIEHAWLSGEWSLELAGEIIAVAIKPNLFTRLFQIDYDSQKLVLKAQSPFARSFAIEQNDTSIGTIEPIHLLTRRATVNCSANVPIPIQIFLFWLTVLMWRRDKSSQNANASQTI